MLYGFILQINLIFGEIELLSLIITPKILFGFFWTNKYKLTKEHILFQRCNINNVFPKENKPISSSLLILFSSSLNCS